MKEYYKELKQFLKFLFGFFIPAVTISVFSVFAIVIALVKLGKVAFN